MSTLHRFAIGIAVAAACGSGCCLTQTCGNGGACGLPATQVVSSCDDGSCGSNACGTCGRRECVPGLYCLARLLKCAPCSEGCGEVYYHEWISDPPAGKDPCNCQGDWTGVPWEGPCGDPTCDKGCGGMCGGMCGTSVGSGCGVAEPVYGPSTTLDGGVGRGGMCMQRPGRILFTAWTRSGGFFRSIGRGIFPYHGYAGYPGPCGGNVCVGRCGGTCSVAPSPTNSFVACQGCPDDCGSCSTATANGDVITQATATAPRPVVSRSLRAAHGRPPHRVVASRMR